MHGSAEFARDNWHPASLTDALLQLGQGTVRNHLSSAVGKTGERNRPEAATIAAEKGWL
jgi:two-component system response regulator DesR